MVKKNILFKGILHGTAISPILARCFVIKLDEHIENVPDEIVIYSVYLWTNYHGVVNFKPNLGSTYIRPGDKVVVDGEIVQDYLEKDRMPIIRMEVKLLYNETLKCGFRF